MMKIEKEELEAVADYITRGIAAGRLFADRTPDDMAAAVFDWKHIDRQSLAAVQKWIAAHLDPTQKKRLQTALRVRRSRSKHPGQNITISPTTRAKLAEYAKRYGVTLSEAIDRLLDLAEREDRQAKLF